MDKLKTFMLHYINMHENLSLKEKKEVWNFVKEASENQISHLLCTGESVSEEVALREISGGQRVEEFIGLDPTTTAGLVKDLIRGVFGQGWTQYMPSLHGASSQFGAGVALTGVTLAALLATLSYSIYKDTFSKSEKACKGKKGLEKNACILKFKIEGKKRQLDKLRKSLTICAKAKNGAKCKAKIGRKIMKVQGELKKVVAAQRGK